ncbi:ribokinase [Dysgonomonas sp. Marseille-P4677]|uniref:ribokinase n=1 Tax=Dysgonomonas sp. Marseille-P4677 TaxID=2364790 RepID=UPI0019133753|nr:ribokinase [Dysgonomonas sp. Marseille-P4677]MBK5720659.1 ribokinase [Dysgonomonas sp. Marseille-P4677]
MKVNKRITVLGSCNTDMVVKSARLPVPGETVLGGTFMMNPGGKGANQAVAAARLGGNVTFITKTGNDLFGRQSLELYADENIDTDYITSDPDLPSGVALITVDANGENCIVVASGANGTLGKEDLKEAKQVITESDILLMQLEIPIDTVEYAAKIANEKGVKVILNPAPAYSLSNELLKNIYILVPNKTEAEIISGVKVTDWDSAKEAADVICSKGVDIVIITLGSLGALLKEGDSYHQIPAEKVEAVDTTAAGDTFCGALSVAISEGKDLVSSIKFANKCSAISVTRMGAQASLPTRQEII